MVGNYLRHIENLTNFQMGVSLMFFLLFLFILYHILKGNKQVYHEFGNIPLEQDVDEMNNDDVNNHK